LRFDFTHPDAVSPDQLERIEAGVNHNILANYALHTTHKPLQQAISEGATALFGEKYGETVRNITIARLGSSSSSTAGQPDVFSNELCGGTHVAETGDIGICLIVSEGSVASGVRRIEAVTGRGAYELIQRRFRVLKETASLFTSSPEEIPQKARIVLDDLNAARKQISALRQQLALIDFLHHLEHVSIIQGVPVLAVEISGADADTLRQMTDRFRHRYPGGVAVLASVSEGKPTVIAAVAEDLVKRGLNAVELVKSIAAPLGGGGGGRPTLAQAGGKDSSKLGEALASVAEWVEMKLKG
jgi:alanyl-tRNA synthetase